MTAPLSPKLISWKKKMSFKYEVRLVEELKKILYLRLN